MALEGKSLADASISEQTDVQAGDYLGIERSGTPARIRADNVAVGLTEWVEQSLDYIDSVNITSSTTSAAKDIPSDYTSIFIRYSGFEPSTSGASLAVVFGTSGAAGPFLTPNFYEELTFTLNGAGTSSTQNTTGFALIGGPVQSPPNNAAQRGTGHAWISELNTADGYPTVAAHSMQVSPTDAWSAVNRDVTLQDADNYNAIQIRSASGTIDNLTLDIFGVRNG